MRREQTGTGSLLQIATISNLPEMFFYARKCLFDTVHVIFRSFDVSTAFAEVAHSTHVPNPDNDKYNNWCPGDEQGETGGG